VLVERQPTPVLFVACEDEIGAIRAAWERLEAVVPLRGRRFFGAFYADGSYRACVERLPEEAAGDLAEGELPGGRYLRERLRGEPPAIYDRLQATFEALEARGRRDLARPGIEHYRRRDQIDVFMPV
jgi:hypothetical protein